MSHTPGPWKVEPSFDSWGRVKVATKRYIEVEGRTREEAEANVLLVAAAPDLLEALQGFLREFGDKAVNANVQKARAAIAKATQGGDNDAER